MTAEPLRSLVYFRASEFRHPSIARAVRAIEALAAERGWSQVATDELTVFSDEIDRASVVVFLLTTGEILDQPARQRLKSAIEGGCGFVGVHSATTAELGWPWYEDLVGAYFKGHPEGTPEGEIDVVDPTHPATRHLPSKWRCREEWYSFRRQPDVVPGTRVILTVDEQSYDAPSELRMGVHPIAWWREVGRGRAFQTALGHDAETYRDPAFVAHLAGAIEWAARRLS
jgi:type 1 glutamine amidotransferase